MDKETLNYIDGCLEYARESERQIWPYETSDQQIGMYNLLLAIALMLRDEVDLDGEEL